MKTIKIIIPIDYTEVSRNTVEYVLVMAKKLRTKFIFVHAYSVPYPSSTPTGMGTMAVPVSGIQESQEKLNESKLQEFIDSFPELTSINYKRYVAFGATVDVICQTAKDENANLIVMGTKGADSSIEEFGPPTTSVLSSFVIPRLSLGTLLPALVIRAKALPNSSYDQHRQKSYIDRHASLQT